MFNSYLRPYWGDKEKTYDSISYKAKLLNVFGEDVHDNLNKCIVEENNKEAKFKRSLRICG
jgi:hypothetical protein